MEIEHFLKRSEGNWISMRSGHSLAFKQFEEIISNLKIKLLNKNEPKVRDFLDKSNYASEIPICPFEIKWKGKSNWQEEANNQVACRRFSATEMVDIANKSPFRFQPLPNQELKVSKSISRISPIKIIPDNLQSTATTVTPPIKNHNKRG